MVSGFDFLMSPRIPRLRLALPPILRQSCHLLLASCAHMTDKFIGNASRVPSELQYSLQYIVLVYSSSTYLFILFLFLILVYSHVRNVLAPPKLGHWRI